MAASLRTQTTGFTSASAVLTGTLTGVQAGDLLVVAFRERDGVTITSVSDTVNGAWSLAVTRAATVARGGIYYFANSAAGSPTVSVTFTGTDQPADGNFSAWSGVQTGAVDTTASTGNTAVTSHPHGSVTPSASSLLITCMASGDHGGLVSLDTGFTALTVSGSAPQPNRQVYAYKTGHTGTLNPSHVVTNSVNSDAMVAAFLESVGGGGGGAPALIVIRKA